VVLRYRIYLEQIRYAATTSNSRPDRSFSFSFVQADAPARLTKTGPAQKAATPERGTKTAKIVALLKRPGGTSLEQLLRVTGWQADSVRGFLTGTLKKKDGPACRFI
jgi:hypothetical protein